MPSFVQSEVSEGVAVVTLDDPGRRNAINSTMNDELLALFDELEARADVAAVVITGAPPAFCAGADLSELSQAEDPDQLRSVYRGFLRIAGSTLPTVAAVNGAAVGAGMNMALACDVILAGESARFETRFLKIGLHPGGGHMWRVSRLAGDRVVRAMILFGEVLDGPRAAEVGLAWRCVPDGDLLETAVTLARGAAEAPRELVARTKDTISRLGSATSAREAVELEIEPQVWSAGQPEFQELLAKLQARIDSRSKP
jgi:enoyl-CoA hydratase